MGKGSDARGDQPGPGRRAFLRGAGLGALGLAAGVRAEVRPQGSRLPGAPFRNYGQPAEAESRVIRWVTDNPDAPTIGVSWTPLHELVGTLTPNGLHYERHHNGVPAIDPAAHHLVVHGRDASATRWTVARLLRYPMVSRQLFIECGGNSNSGWTQEPPQAPVGWLHGLVSCSEWTGVPLRLLLEEAGVARRPGWLIAEGADAWRLHMSIPLEKAFDDCFIALYQNGERLRPENGYPMRLIVPGWEGVLHVKWLSRLEVSDVPAMARNETSRYTELMPDGRARQFTFFMEAKSLITQPAMGDQLAPDDYLEIAGLAWSGRGRITGVDISLDGGAHWHPAELQGPVTPTCFTRFRLPWRWDGKRAVLQSRARDETGYVQPARDVLLEARGRWGYFHYNAIVSWSIDEDGFISHVYA
jgi:sulfane dehydrogenase subunit SoxC